MTQTHPITPPEELVEQLRTSPGTWLKQITIAYQAGADQELEACCQWLPKLPPWSGNDLRKHRRPKPPSQKEQALESVSRLCASVIHDDLKNDAAIVRRALEALND